MNPSDAFQALAAHHQAAIARILAGGFVIAFLMFAARCFWKEINR